MDKTQAGDIRKITIGDLKNGFCFQVNQTVPAGDNPLTITKIIRDENNFYFFGCIQYQIYAKLKDEPQFVWKYFENQPVYVECFV